MQKRKEGGKDWYVFQEKSCKWSWEMYEGMFVSWLVLISIPCANMWLMFSYKSHYFISKVFWIWRMWGNHILPRHFWKVCCTTVYNAVTLYVIHNIKYFGYWTTTKKKYQVGVFFRTFVFELDSIKLKLFAETLKYTKSKNWPYIITLFTKAQN